MTGLSAAPLVDGPPIRQFVALPLHEMDIMQALECRQDPGCIEALARRCCVRIPDQTVVMEQLVEDYLVSPLRDFHRWFYEARHDPPERWPETYARTPLDPLPPCVRNILTYPNNLLMKPSGIQLVTRCLLAVGWHPRHIAGLIRSKFEDPVFNWGDRWKEYDAGLRADLYFRLFAGQLAEDGIRNIEFTCESEKKKGFCWPGDPPCSLKPFQDALNSATSQNPQPPPDFSI